MDNECKYKEIEEKAKEISYKTGNSYVLILFILTIAEIFKINYIIEKLGCKKLKILISFLIALVIILISLDL